jgi:hypothetical protein
MRWINRNPGREEKRFSFFHMSVETISGRILHPAAQRKSTGLPKTYMAKIRISGPGPSSSSVGRIFLKIVWGSAMKPCGIISSRKCATKDAHATMKNFSQVSNPDLTAKAVMMHEEEI